MNMQDNFQLTNNNNNNKHFAEVIESSLHGWSAQCWDHDITPTFGSIVTINTKKYTSFSIVYHISTGPTESHRSPFIYQMTEEELRAQQPQIFSFLKTIFSCAPIGYIKNNEIIYQITPEPPKIHSFVMHASEQQIKQISDKNHYLHILFNTTTINNIDELLLAFLRLQREKQLLSIDKILTLIDTYSILINNDYRRLKLFLQRVQPLLL